MGKLKYVVNGEVKDVYAKAADTVPIGATVEIPDDMSVPDGWELVEDEDIKVLKSSIGSKNVVSQDIYTEMATITADKDKIIVLTVWLLFPRNVTGDRGVCIKLNGTEQCSEIVQSARDNSTRVCVSCVCNLKQNDNIQILALQTSGATISVNGAYSMLEVIK